MVDVFISYARSTEAIASRIAQALRALGYEVWRDDELPAHRAYSEVIEERLTTARAVVVVWSEDAVHSQWVRSEANRARDQAKLVQLRVDRTPLPMPFDQLQCVDLAGWRGEAEAAAWRKVVESVAELVGSAPAGPLPARAASATVDRRRRVRPAFALGFAALAAIGVGAGALALFHSPAVSGSCLRSVAVMPIRNLTGDPSQAALAQQLTEDVIYLTGKGGYIIPTPAAQVASPALQGLDPQRVGRALHVRYVASGSLRRDAGGLRLAVQLIDARTGHVEAADDLAAATLPGRSPEPPLATSYFGLIAHRIVERWQTAELARPHDDHDPENLTARIFAVAGGKNDAEAGRLQDLGRLALAVTPAGNPLRLAQASAICTHESDRLEGGLYRDQVERRQLATDALAWADRGLELRETAVSPHVCRERIYALTGRWDDAWAEIRHILSLSPLTALGWFAREDLEFRQARFTEAAADARSAADRDPDRHGNGFVLGQAQLFAGQLEPAVETLRDSVSSDSTDPKARLMLTAALQMSGRAAEARASAAAYRALPADPQAWRVFVADQPPAFVTRAAQVQAALAQLGLHPTGGRISASS